MPMPGSSDTKEAATSAAATASAATATATATAAAPAPASAASDAKDSKQGGNPPFVLRYKTLEEYLKHPAEFDEDIKQCLAKNQFQLIIDLIKAQAEYFSGSILKRNPLLDNKTGYFYIKLAVGLVYERERYEDETVFAAYAKREVPPAVYVRYFSCPGLSDEFLSPATELIRCAKLGYSDRNDKAKSDYHWQVVDALLTVYPKMVVDETEHSLYKKTYGEAASRTDHDRHTALMYAAKAGRYDIARKIAERSKNIVYQHPTKGTVASYLKGYGEDQCAIAKKYVGAHGIITINFWPYVVKLLSRVSDQKLKLILRLKLESLCEDPNIDPFSDIEGVAGNSIYQTALDNNDGLSLAVMIRDTKFKYVSADQKQQNSFVEELARRKPNECSIVLKLLIQYEEFGAILEFIPKLISNLNAEQHQKYLEQLAQYFYDQCKTAADKTKPAPTMAGSLDQKHSAVTTTSAGAPAVATLLPERLSQAECNDLEKIHDVLLRFYTQFITKYPQKHSEFRQKSFFAIAKLLLQAEALFSNEGFTFLTSNFYRINVHLRDVHTWNGGAQTLVFFGGMNGLSVIQINELLAIAKGETRAALIRDYSVNCKNAAEFKTFVMSYGVTKQDWHCIASLHENVRIDVATFNAVLDAIINSKDDFASLEDKVGAIETLCATYHPASADKHRFVELLNHAMDKGKLILARAMFRYGYNLLPAKEQIPTLANKLITKYKAAPPVSAAQQKVDESNRDHVKAKSTIDYGFVSELDQDNFKRKNDHKQYDANKVASQGKLTKCLFTELITVETDYTQLYQFLGLGGPLGSNKWKMLSVPLLRELEPSVWDRIFNRGDVDSWDGVKAEARKKFKLLVLNKLDTLRTTIETTNYSDPEAIKKLLESLSTMRTTADVLQNDRQATEEDKKFAAEMIEALAAVCKKFNELPVNKALLLMQRIVFDLGANGPTISPRYMDPNYLKKDLLYNYQYKDQYRTLTLTDRLHREIVQGLKTNAPANAAAAKPAVPAVVGVGNPLSYSTVSVAGGLATLAASTVSSAIATNAVEFTAKPK